VAVVVEAYRIQFKNTLLHSEKSFPYKLLLLVSLAISFITLNTYVFIAYSLVAIILFLLIREYRIIIYSLEIYVPPALLIIVIDYFTGTLTYFVIATLIFGYASFINILLVYATTPIKQLYRFLGRNTLTLSLLMLHNIVSELYEVLESKRSRGWELGFNILRHFQFIFDAIRIMIERMEGLTIALKSRGLE
jgi:hypothetical protein